MIRRTSPLALLIALALLPGAAHAQRGYRGGGQVISPYGVEYNTNSPEFGQSGGDMFQYQELMEQKMMYQQMLQMQQMQKQQLAAEKQMQDYLKKHPEVKQQIEDQQKKMLAAQQPKAKKKKKKPAATSAAKAKAAAAPKPGAEKEEEGEKTAAAAAKPAAPAKPSLATARGK